jgi:hypothetical protein
MLPNIASTVANPTIGIGKVPIDKKKNLPLEKYPQKLQKIVLTVESMGTGELNVLPLQRINPIIQTTTKKETAQTKMQ